MSGNDEPLPFVGARPFDGGSAPVAAQPLPQQIASYLRDLIIHDVLKPGERIREVPLSAELNVSRTPLRDALKILSVERLVELAPNRGAVVTDMSIEEMRDLLRVYSSLEALGAQMACERARTTDIAAIHGWQNEMLAAFEQNDRLRYFRANQAFHLSIIKASRNASLIEVHAQLNLRLYRVRYLAIMQQQEWTFVSSQHEAILAALDQRDGPLLSRLLVEHLSGARRAIATLEAAGTPHNQEIPARSLA
ncbi:GntR family transcriptional regulator [Microvirga zambiensis]|uniref:GntR family transcriptional regulator n=1 Tax=Microvirga zambiensis TaxID=1402137 RepID=UPI00191EC799|nr:GntR family transcriptional regulator [Microvirga zambiensis]